MTLREKVARAICYDMCGRPDKCHCQLWGDYLPHSQAAIEAMFDHLMEPSSSMKLSGLFAEPTKGPLEIGDEVLPINVWQAMLTQARKEMNDE